MNEYPIPIFDSLMHPTMDSNWINDKYQGTNCIENITAEMEKYNISGAFAVGMQGIGAYDVKLYSQFIMSQAKNMYPIAYFNFDVVSNEIEIEKQLLDIKARKYTGIKIHPRFSGISLEDIRLDKVINLAGEMDLKVLLCTYFYERSGNFERNNIYTLNKLVSKVPKVKILLLHAGSVRLLEMMELTRVHPNILLDLSFTICKYEGSSIDLDIKYLFQNFDRRICIGSDSPEFTLRKLRERFEFFSNGIQKKKLENIAYKNILDFMGGTND